MTWDVALIGAGPVALTLANLLGRRGVRVLVLERQAQPFPLPRAIHFDGEVMRGFQAAGVAAAVLPHTCVGLGMRFQDASGRVLVDWSRDPKPGPMGWHESYRVYQPGLEAALEAAARARPTVEIRRGVEVTQVIPGTPVRLETNGAAVEARYVVGCDGANSLTRHAIGGGQRDLGFRERWLVVDLRLTTPRPDLGDHTVQHCDAQAPATYGRGVGDWRRWEFRLAPTDPDPVPDPEIWARLSRWIAPTEARLERAAVYTFRSQLAEVWRDGPLLIAGDAAHQMPPFMGQGMGAGIRDAVALGWRLAAALRGAPEVLDSYASERAAHVETFIARSVALGRLINQTAAGAVPEGPMASIWPELGPGLGPRDGMGGALAPQISGPEGRGDDLIGHQFHVLAAGPVSTRLPLLVSAEDWLAERNAPAAIVRPDGYALGPLTTKAEAWAFAMNARIAPLAGAAPSR